MKFLKRWETPKTLWCTLWALLEFNNQNTRRHQRVNFRFMKNKAKFSLQWEISHSKLSSNGWTQKGRLRFRSGTKRRRLHRKKKFWFNKDKRVAKIAMASNYREQIIKAICQRVPKEILICKQLKFQAKKAVFKKNGKKISMSNLMAQTELQLTKIQYLRGTIRQ